MASREIARGVVVRAACAAGLLFWTSSAFCAQEQVNQALLLLKGACVIPSTKFGLASTEAGYLDVLLQLPDGAMRSVQLERADARGFASSAAAMNAQDGAEHGECMGPLVNEVIARLAAMREPASPRVPSPVSAPVTAPPHAGSPAAETMPRSATRQQYDDGVVRAQGMPASVGSKARGTVIPLKLENAGSEPLLLGRDREAATAITNTGETTYYGSGCVVGGVRDIHFDRLSSGEAVDPIHYSRVMPQGMLMISLRCDIRTEDHTRISSVNVNLPLVRLEGKRVVRFTVSLADIPISDR